MGNNAMRFAQGGKFEHGFMSGFVFSLGGTAINNPNMSIGARVALSAVIGSTAEKLGGGKPARRSLCGGGFANGAVTGAYVMMFNHLGHQRRENIEKSRTQLSSKLNEAIQKSHEFYQNGGFYEEHLKPFGIDFSLDGFTPNSDFQSNLFESIPISVGDIAYIVDVYMATASNPSNPLFNTGVEFYPLSSNDQGRLPIGWNMAIHNNVETTFHKSSTILIINFQNENNYRHFLKYITW